MATKPENATGVQQGTEANLALARSGVFGYGSAFGGHPGFAWGNGSRFVGAGYPGYGSYFAQGYHPGAFYGTTSYAPESWATGYTNAPQMTYSTLPVQAPVEFVAVPQAPAPVEYVMPPPVQAPVDTVHEEVVPELRSSRTITTVPSEPVPVMTRAVHMCAVPDTPADIENTLRRSQEGLLRTSVAPVQVATVPTTVPVAPTYAPAFTQVDLRPSYVMQPNFVAQSGFYPGFGGYGFPQGYYGVDPRVQYMNVGAQEEETEVPEGPVIPEKMQDEKTYTTENTGNTVHYSQVNPGFAPLGVSRASAFYGPGAGAIRYSGYPGAFGYGAYGHGHGHVGYF